MTTQTVECVVVGLQNNPIAAGVPSASGLVLTWNGSAWQAGGPAVLNSSVNVTAGLFANGGLQVT